jgi:hypothetical protein
MRVTAAALVLLAPSLAGAFAVAATSRGAPLHWESGPVAIAVDESAPPRTLDAEDVARALDGALAAWSQVPESRVALERSAGAPNLVRFINDGAWPGQRGQLGLTQLDAHEQSGAITTGVIYINEGTYPFTVEPARGRYDLQAVLTHELGHLLGLGHSADGAATMYAGTAPGDAHQRTPGADDRAGVAALYDVTPPPAPAYGCSLSDRTPTRGKMPHFIFAAIGLMLSTWRRRASS